MLLRRAALTLLALFATIAATLALIPAAPAIAIVDRDCGDFATQRQAQTFFLNHNPRSDPHRLDSDGDAIACEDLPCPCSTSGGSTPEPSPATVKRDFARVVDVTDGDTIRVRLKGKVQRVRLLGIDTPEVYSRTECGSASASKSARRLLPVGSRVLLVSDPSQALRDRYGRLLRYVSRNGHDISRVQVQRGWAKVYVYAHQPFKRVATYRSSQIKAKAAERGVWGRCDGKFHRPA